MKRVLTTLALAALSAAGAGTVFAEVFVEAVSFQSGRIAGPARPAVWSDAAEVSVDAKKPLLLRGKAVLKNRGPKPAEGLLVRYMLKSHLVAVNGAPEDGGEAMTFLLDERRVPKIGANSVLEISLTLTPKLDLYLAKLKRNGFRADTLTIKAMLEPHADAPVRVVQGTVGLKP